MPEKEKKQNTEPKKKIGDKIIDSFGVLGKFDPFQTYKFSRDDYKEYQRQVKEEENKTKPEKKTEPEKKTQPETNAEKKSKRLEELKKEIEGKSKGGFIVGKGADYIKDLL